jgi:hypothetical protein
VERPCPSTTYFEEIGLTRRCIEPLPAWPFLAKVSDGLPRLRFDSESQSSIKYSLLLLIERLHLPFPAKGYPITTRMKTGQEFEA